MNKEKVTIDSEYYYDLLRKENILEDFEKWLKEHSKIDYECRPIIVHEQLALNTAYEYLQYLKKSDSNE